MKPVHRVLIWLVSLSLLALPAAAQAKMLMRITISGPGLPGEVEVTDREVLHALFDLPTGKRLREAPPGLGKAYFTIRQEVGDGDRIFAVNVYHYYVDPQGGPGYLFFADVINGSASIEGDWFQVNENTGRALQALLAAQMSAPAENPERLFSGAIVRGLGYLFLGLIGLWVGFGSWSKLSRNSSSVG